MDLTYEENYTDIPDGWDEPCEQTNLSLRSVTLVIIYIIVFLLSLLGNSVVIFVVSCSESRMTSTDVYLMHLALADLLFSLTLPFWAAYVHSEWIFGTFLCKLLSGLQEATFYSCVFLLACISIDRYLAIVKATRVISRKRHMVRVVCGVVWLIAGMLSLPVIVQREAFDPSGSNRLTCYENLTAETMDDWRLGLRLLRHTLGFFLPLSIMLVCYGCTMGTLFHARNSHKRKAMRVILSVVLAFIICWLPYNVTELVDTLMRGKLLDDNCMRRGQVDIAQYMTEVLAFLHCAINPLLYAFIGKKFRNQLLTSLFKKGLIRKEILST